MLKGMSTTVRVNGTVQFTFSFVTRPNITIVTSCDSLIVILVPYFLSLKLENGSKKQVQNVTEIKHRFVKLVVIFAFFTRCHYVIPSLKVFSVTTTRSHLQSSLFFKY